MFRGIFNNYSVQYLINKARSIYYPIFFCDFEADQIAPDRIKGLWLGSLESACDYEAIKTNNITHIVTAVWDVDPIFPQDDSIKYFKIPIIDRSDQSINDYFDEVYEFIDDAITKGEGVLVHCVYGVSRSPTLVCAYLMRKYSIDAAAAIKYVQASRPQSQPNIGFIMQLVNISGTSSV